MSLAAIAFGATAVIFAFGLNSSLTRAAQRSEEHTSELQSPFLISYAVFCLKKKNTRLNSSHPSLSRMPSSA